MATPNEKAALDNRIAELLHKRGQYKKIVVTINAELKSLRVRAARLATNDPKKQTLAVEELERLLFETVMDSPDEVTNVPTSPFEELD